MSEELEKTDATPEPKPAETDVKPENGSVEEGSSLASKVLTGLALLVAGGFLALWFGPQIAPQLPAGLAPVAEFFAPQANIETDARLTEIEDTQRGFENRVTARLDDLTQADREARADIAQLSEDLRTRGSGGSSAADIARLNAAIDDLRTRVAQLAVRIENLPTDAAANVSGDLAEASGAVSALRAEIARLSEQQIALQQDLSTTKTEFDTRLATATNEMSTVTEAARVQVGSAQNRQLVVELERALNSGEPFFALVDNSEVSLPPALAAAASTGVATLPEIKERFADIAYDAIRADISANASEGALGRLSAFLQQQVAVRSLEPLEGDGTDAILSRIDVALAQDDLARALNEAEGLSPGPARALDAWLNDVRQRQAALAALAQFASGR